MVNGNADFTNANTKNSNGILPISYAMFYWDPTCKIYVLEKVVGKLD